MKSSLKVASLGREITRKQLVLIIKLHSNIHHEPNQKFFRSRDVIFVTFDSKGE